MANGENLFDVIRHQTMVGRKHNTWDHLPLVTVMHVMHMKTGRVAFSADTIGREKTLDELIDIANYAEYVYNRMVKEDESKPNNTR